MSKVYGSKNSSCVIRIYVADKFSLLNYGLAIVLVFIGTKMLLLDVFKIPALVSLVVIISILAVTMWLSIRKAKKEAIK